MPFEEFLLLVKVLKLLYGGQIAATFFEKNIDLYYDLDYNTFIIEKNKEVKS